MPKFARSALGEIVDFDLILIKHQLSQAPQNIEVARRQNFIDNKETTDRQVKKRPDQWVAMPDVTQAPPVSSTNFEELGEPVATKVEPPAPPTISRK
jgi:hypothetical protein